MIKDSDKIFLDHLKNGEIPVNFNWNSEKHDLIPDIKVISPEPNKVQASNVELVSECRRDGIQGINVYPDNNISLSYISKIYEMGIERITIAMFPGNNARVNESTDLILDYMREKTPNATPIVLSIATDASLDWLRHCKSINPKLESIIFMGTSPMRLMVEGWNKTTIINKLSKAIDIATNSIGIGVIGATEHTTETPPDFLKQIIEAQIKSGAKSFCIADTTGRARPLGAYKITTFTRNVMNELGATDKKLEWHGHRDLGNDVGNSMAAIAAGADRIHVVARGVGERAGNTQMEAVMLNLCQILADYNMKPKWKMNMLSETLNLYDELVNLTPPSHGVLGNLAFEARSGLHIAAMQKAMVLSQKARQIGLIELANQLEATSRTVYSAIDPELVGRQHNVKISPLSGSASVKWINEKLHIKKDLTQEEIDQVLDYANTTGRDLTEDEIKKILLNTF